jgi:predicted AAA+ superfamily ATPase
MENNFMPENTSKISAEPVTSAFLMCPRTLFSEIQKHLSRGKSILLLGARQTGKTTLLSQIKVDLAFNLMQSETRRRYEARPELFSQEIRFASLKKNTPLLIFIDEIQKNPELLNDIQVLIDEKIAQFILTGSSARKLRLPPVNLLPGRVVKFQLDPLTLEEISQSPFPENALENFLLYGSLPGIFFESNPENKDIDLRTYVDAYLEEEVRAEALVRNMGSFSRFLELATSESGYIINMNKLASDVGVKWPPSLRQPTSKVKLQVGFKNTG